MKAWAIATAMQRLNPEQRLNGRRSQVCSAPDDSDFFR
jgi:hypothetical protein